MIPTTKSSKNTAQAVFFYHFELNGYIGSHLDSYETLFADTKHAA